MNQLITAERILIVQLGAMGCEVGVRIITPAGKLPNVSLLNVAHKSKHSEMVYEKCIFSRNHTAVGGVVWIMWSFICQRRKPY